MVFPEQSFLRIFAQRLFYYKPRRIFVFVLFVFFILSLTSPVVAHASDSLVDVYFFRGEGCPHCAKEEKFLAYLENEFPWLKVHSFEIWYNRENAALLQRIKEEFSLNVAGVPITFIGDNVFSGYSEDTTTGKAMREAIEECYLERCPDAVGEFITGEIGHKKDDDEYPEGAGRDQQQEEVQQTGQDDFTRGSGRADWRPALGAPTVFHVPFIGGIEATSLSLPVLTIVIAALDGFNPCAMWILIYLIGLLLGIKSITRRWTLGLTFIIVSAAVYLLFMAAWLNLLLFIGFIVWVRIVIGGGAVAIGMYSIRKFLKNPRGVCEISKDEKRQRIFAKLGDISARDSLLLALGGIAILAFAVNLVELMCSAGFPAVYTHVLTLSHLPTSQYYLYLLFYVFVFMLDDMIIFFIAMVVLRRVGLDGRYVRYSSFIGGTIMLILGLLLIFRPNLLMFG